MALFGKRKQNSAAANSSSAPEQNGMLTLEQLLQLIHGHAPQDVSSREAADCFRAAAEQLIMPGAFAMKIDPALRMLEEARLKQNIRAADTDTLMVFFKYLAVEAGKQADNDLVAAVQNDILGVLLERLNAPQPVRIRLIRQCDNPAESICTEEDVFLAPFTYDGEGLTIAEPDPFIHTTRHAAERMQSGAQVWALGGIPEGYAMAAQNDGRRMHFRLLMNSGNNTQWIPLFTGFGALYAMFGCNVRVAMVTIEDARTLCHECSGIVVAPGSVNLLLPGGRPAF